MSRKYTQFDEVSEETVIRYFKKLSDKYTLGVVIADVPSNKTGLHKGIFEVYPRRDLIRTNDSWSACAGSENTTKRIKIREEE
mgnify:CR=1 FL=1